MPSKQYLAAAHPTGGHATRLEHHHRGRHVFLGAVVDQQVQTYLTKLPGGVLNSAIALAAARGIQKDTGGGQLHELGRGWAKSFMQRMGFVIRKATKTGKKLPPKELKESVLYSTAAKNSIPADLIVNWDQTGAANGARQRLNHDN